MKSPHRRFALLAACLLLVACASAPETKTTPRKKKHRKHDDVTEKHAKKKHSDDDGEKPDKPKKKTADASDDDDDTVSVADDDDDSGAKAKKSKKKKEADEKAEAEKERKQREKEEKAEREKQKAEEKAEEEKQRKQREKEEKAEREKAKAEEEEKAEKEAKAKKKKKASEDVAEDNSDEKMAKKKKKNAEETEEDPAEVDMTGDSDDDGAETRTAAKGKKGKAAAKTAAKGKAAKGKKAKKKADEDEPADDTETAAADEPEPETPVAEEKAKPSKGTKAKLAKAEKPAKTKGNTDAEDGDVIEMTGEESDDSGTRVAAIPVPGVDSEHEEPELGAAKANSDEPAPAAVAMSAINDRPLTLPASKLEVHGGLRVNSIFFPATMGTQARTQRSEGLALGVGYGVSDKLEVGADYTLLVNPGTVKGPITFHAAYRAYVTPKLEIAAAVGFGLDFDARVDQTTMKTSTQTYAALELGAWARYRLGRKASLFSGIPATPSSSAPITNLAFPLPPEPYQLGIGLNGGPSALDLPIGIGYQVSNSFYTLFMTDLAHVGLKNSPNAFLFKDIIPFGLGGFYVFEKVDFGLVLSDDIKKDTLRFDAVVRYPIK